MTTKEKLIAKTALVIVLAIIDFFIVILPVDAKNKPLLLAPSLYKLNTAIDRAKTYYEGMYKEVSGGSVMVEYYSSPKSVYTIRHATIGGYHYFNYIGDATKSANLKKIIDNNKHNAEADPHALIWKYENDIPTGYFYTTEAYPDCSVKLPTFGDVLPYHSKMCKIGGSGIRLFLLVSRFDPLINLTDLLQDTNKINYKKLIDLENKYSKLGFGIPMCSPFGCMDVSSTIRTAQFGEIELRNGDLRIADSVATNLINAQDKNGAIFLSYDNKGNFKVKKPLMYKIIDKFLNDEPIYNGFIPTNAESMADALAFLMHYRCQKYSVCN